MSDTHEIGVVCPQCDAFNEPGADVCIHCGFFLTSMPGVRVPRLISDPTLEHPEMTLKTSLASIEAKRREREAAKQVQASAADPEKSARVCLRCGSMIPPAHKFCGECGWNATEVSPGASAGLRRAALVQASGTGPAGKEHPLRAETQTIGRTTGEIQFPDDPYLSNRHITLFYRGGNLFARAAQSVNGVYMRIRVEHPIARGTMIRAGQQLLMMTSFDNRPLCLPDTPDVETYPFASAAIPPQALWIAQILRGGRIGSVWWRNKPEIVIGRDKGDICFPYDPYMSGKHLAISLRDGRLRVRDLGSANGTFLAVRGEVALHDGDEILAGVEVLTVRVPPA